MIIEDRYITKLQITAAIGYVLGTLWWFWVEHQQMIVDPMYGTAPSRTHYDIVPFIMGSLVCVFCLAVGFVWDWLAKNDKYPLTQEEAYRGAGYTNLYQVTSFSEWRRLHYLYRERWISWDRDGNILPGKYGWNDHEARCGRTQVYGPIGVNVVTAYDGPILYLEWMSFCQHIGQNVSMPISITDR